jgi:AcrR family transcriptional regulator
MALTRTPRNSWIDEGLRALASGGPDAVRIESLARVLGVTKGGFYWHFDGRHALLEEMLERWERASVDEVIERIEGRGGDARDKLRRLSALASTRYEELGIDPVSIDLAVRDRARRDKAVARRLRRVDNRRMEYMRSLFGALGFDEDEVEARCILAFSLWIGNQFIAADHGGRSRASVLKQAMRQLEDGRIPGKLQS